MKKTEAEYIEQVMWQIMWQKKEEFGCNYPQPHPPYCRCKNCKKYIQWLKTEYPQLLKGMKDAKSW